MQAAWHLIAIFLSTSVLAVCVATLVYDVLLRDRLNFRDRINLLADGGDNHPQRSLFKDLNRLQSLDEQASRSLKCSLQHLLEQSGTQLTFTVLVARSCGCAAALAIPSAYYAWWCAALIAPVGAVIPMLFILWRRRVRQQQLCRQLPKVFAMISRAVKSGQTVTAAIQIIADEFEPPVSLEFALCYEQQNLGVSRETALRKLAARTGVMELQIFVVALLVQAKSGGNLVELLDNLALMIRNRLKLQDRVRALTGEGRMQATVLVVLPVMAMAGIVCLAPDYAQELLSRPWLLLATAGAQGLGALWIRRIVNFEY